MSIVDKENSTRNAISRCVLVALITVGCCLAMSPSVFPWGTDILPVPEDQTQTDQSNQNNDQYNADGNLDLEHHEAAPVNAVDTTLRRSADHSKAEVEFDDTCFCGEGSNKTLCVDSNGAIVELRQYRGEHCPEENTA